MQTTRGKMPHQSTAPDGGYGWVVCAVAFVISMICDGVVYSYGVIMPEIMKTFDCGASTAAMIGAIQTGIFQFPAMIILALASQFGCR